MLIIDVLVQTKVLFPMWVVDVDYAGLFMLYLFQIYHSLVSSLKYIWSSGELTACFVISLLKEASKVYVHLCLILWEVTSSLSALFWILFVEVHEPLAFSMGNGNCILFVLRKPYHFSRMCSILHEIYFCGLKNLFASYFWFDFNELDCRYFQESASLYLYLASTGLCVCCCRAGKP